MQTAQRFLAGAAKEAGALGQRYGPNLAFQISMDNTTEPVSETVFEKAIAEMDSTTEPVMSATWRRVQFELVVDHKINQDNKTW